MNFGKLSRCLRSNPFIQVWVRVVQTSGKYLIISVRVSQSVQFLALYCRSRYYTTTLIVNYKFSARILYSIINREMCNRRLPGRVRQRTRSSRCWRTTTSWWRRSSNTRTRTRTGSSRTRSSQDLNTTSCERGASDEPTPCRKSHPELIWQRLFLRSKVIYRDFTWKL